MGISKAQRDCQPIICKCGCGETFKPFPTYRKRADGGGLYTPQFKRGHNPNTIKSITERPAWNKGLKASDHNSISRMGFQKGHPAYNDWTKINERLKKDPAFKAGWVARKKGHIPWNRGSADWRTVKTGARKRAPWKNLRRLVLERDNYTCQNCGLKTPSDKKAIQILDCHHKIEACVKPDLFLVETNLITLCKPCHLKAHGRRSKKSTP